MTIRCLATPAVGLLLLSAVPPTVFGKAGMSRWELELGGFDSAFGRVGKGTDETVAVGVDFNLDVFAVRAQFARTDFGGVDVEFDSIGFMLRF